jgi:hypothetical protein
MGPAPEEKENAMGRYIVRFILRTPDRVSGYNVTIRALSPADALAQYERWRASELTFADATPVAVWDSAEVECRARRRT